MSGGWGQDCIDDIEVGLWGECYNIEYSTYLSLYGTGLTGPIHPEIGDLVNLIELDLRSNYLSGQIPEEIGNLKYFVRSLPKAHETELNAGLFNTYTLWVTTSSNISITGKDRFSVYDLLDMSNDT